MMQYDAITINNMHLPPCSWLKSELHGELGGTRKVLGFWHAGHSLCASGFLMQEEDIKRTKDKKS